MSTDEAGVSADEHRGLAQEMYDRWQAGEKKSRLEIEYWDDAVAHGSRFSKYVKKWLGRETVKDHPQTVRLAKAESLLRVHGLSLDDEDDLPEQYRLLAKSREAALAALRVYNDPLAQFRTETFAVLMVTAWNSLFQAICERDGTDYIAREGDGTTPQQIDSRDKVVDTRDLMTLAIGGDDMEAVRANIDFWIGLRNQVAHRYIPTLDPVVVPEAQSLLLNYENTVVAEFGEDAQLGDRLTVPLHLTGFRNDAATKSLKELQARLPPDVNDYLARHRQSLPNEVVRSPEYSMRVYLVSVAANRANQADATLQCIRPEDVSDELLESLADVALLPKPKRVAVASDGLLKPGQVWTEVQDRTGFKFTNNRHAAAWHYYNVRPDTGSERPELTDERYCVYDGLNDNYGYTRAWVEKLVRELADGDRYREVIGMEPDPA